MSRKKIERPNQPWKPWRRVGTISTSRKCGVNVTLFVKPALSIFGSEINGQRTEKKGRAKEGGQRSKSDDSTLVAFDALNFDGKRMYG